MNENDIVALESALRQEAKSAPTDETKRIRVLLGVYMLRGQPGRYIIRIRMPAGIITETQLRTVADLAEESGWESGAHLTTRQGIEIAGVPTAQVLEFLQRLDEVGLTTSHTGGPVVRGVVACPFSGVVADGIIDVTPYALAADRYFREHAGFQKLPRKIKMAFESCPHDHVRTHVSDIGVEAACRDGQNGFRIVVGGGLGASPKVAAILEEFILRENLFVTLEAVLRVFNRHGYRENRSRARLKWLLADWGIEKLRDEVRKELAGLGAEWTMAEVVLPEIIEAQPSPGALRGKEVPAGEADAFADWRQSNVHPQRQDGWVAVCVRCPQGDLSPDQLRQLAEAGKKFAGGIRTSIDQNLVLRWVRGETLADLYEVLRAINLAGAGVEQLPDVTRCVGTTACLSAITNPRSAAEAIVASLTTDFSSHPALRHLRIRISGCPNACGHHHAADIGLYGISKRVNVRAVPHYAVLLGGSNTGETFGTRAIDVPAYRLPQAIEEMLKFHRDHHAKDESFPGFVGRVGLPAIRQHLDFLTHIPAWEVEPAAYRDLGSAQDFSVGVRGGECAV